MLKGTTHIAFATTIYTSLNTITLIEPQLFLCMMVGALAPDIDKKNTMISNRLFKLPFVTHRKETHSLVTSLVIATILCICFPKASTWIIAFFIGVLSHILLDMFNLRGVYLLWPFTKTRISFRKKNTSLPSYVVRKREKWIDHICMIGFTAISIFLIVYQSSLFMLP
ncbi:metal-dependent hydrolase [Longirhabdus pacifica]|uniref:metal-dependent hydrolase n=1 Tax=Longirhabdus pacifica TaxID=2305227 RepID=UPI0013E8CD6A|nr:metal-dependent hydrolase [Longirhabdus pacifica]